MSQSDLTNQEKLEEIYHLTLENNRMLHSIQSRDRISLILRVIYWLAIVGALGGAFYYIRPFYEAIQSGNTKAEGVLHQFEELRAQFPETKAFQQIMERFKNPEEQDSSEPI